MHEGRIESIGNHEELIKSSPIYRNFMNHSKRGGGIMKNEKHRNLRPKDTKRTLLRLFSYIKYNKGMFFGGILFIILGAMAEISTNAMLSPMIDELTGDRNLSLIIKYIIIMGMLVALIAIGQYFGNLFMVKLSQELSIKSGKIYFLIWKNYLYPF